MGLDAMALYRFARKLHQRGIPLLPDFLRMAIYYLHNSYIPYEAELGEGTQLGYGGIGVVIHKDAKIGRHCLISQQVTISNRSAHEGVPEIGDYVRIGAGAKILGNVRIGDFAVIGANAVVVRDVPAAAVVAGVPARVLRKEGDPLLAYLREMGKLTPGAARLPPGQLAAHFTETTLQ
jgi:serine O-acetyltransferase